MVTVETETNTSNYVDMTGNSLKTRYYNHIKSVKNKRYKNETELSEYIWKPKEKEVSTIVFKTAIFAMYSMFLYLLFFFSVLFLQIALCTHVAFIYHTSPTSTTMYPITPSYSSFNIPHHIP